MGSIPTRFRAFFSSLDHLMARPYSGPLRRCNNADFYKKIIALHCGLGINKFDPRRVGKNSILAYTSLRFQRFDQKSLLVAGGFCHSLSSYEGWNWDHFGGSTRLSSKQFLLPIVTESFPKLEAILGLAESEAAASNEEWWKTKRCWSWKGLSFLSFGSKQGSSSHARVSLYSLWNPTPVLKPSLSNTLSN